MKTFSRPQMFLRCAGMLLACCTTQLPTTLRAADPIRIHPDNPHYFEWRGHAVALITSAEHYGAVVNPDFDFHRYLDTLQQAGLNYTRLFAGTYIEPQGAFGIERNTLAPAPGRFLAPWARSQDPGYAGGGNKFDLTRFSPEYLTRLKAFIAEAGQRGIVVELTLFCSTYGEQQWALHPLNPLNNHQALAVSDWKKLHTLENPAAFAVQEKFTRYLIRELNGYDNLFYEIQNEPWSDNHTLGDTINPYLPDAAAWQNGTEIITAISINWQRAIAKIIADEESRLPQRHLIAQNVANFRLALNADDLVPEASLLNFHYAYPEAAEWNRGHARIIGYDETGFAGNQDGTYRRQAWNFIFSGGGLFNHLDYSFTSGREDGTDTANQAPGGGSPALRQQLRGLSQFIHHFNLAQLRPDSSLVRQSPGVVVRALSHPGEAHALYLQGRSPSTLSLNLAAGTWHVEWISIEDGSILKQETIVSHTQPVGLTSPRFTEAIALKCIRQK